MFVSSIFVIITHIDFVAMVTSVKPIWPHRYGALPPPARLEWDGTLENFLLSYRMHRNSRARFPKSIKGCFHTWFLSDNFGELSAVRIFFVCIANTPK